MFAIGRVSKVDTEVIVALIGGLGTLAGALLAFLGSRKSSLATAEKDFRDTIIKENKELRQRIAELENELLVAKRRLLKIEAICIKAGLVIDDDEED